MGGRCGCYRNGVRVNPLVGPLVGPLVDPLVNPLVGPLVGPLVVPLVVPLVDPLVVPLVVSLGVPLVVPLVVGPDPLLTTNATHIGIATHSVWGTFLDALYRYIRTMIENTKSNTITPPPPVLSQVQRSALCPTNMRMIPPWVRHGICDGLWGVLL